MSTPSAVSFVTNSSAHTNPYSVQTFPLGSFGSIAQEPPSSSLNVPGNGAIAPLVSSPMDNLANGSVVMTNETITHPIMVDIHNTPLHHICPGQFHFITSLPTYATAHRLIALPMLNYMMTTKEWRSQYGASPTLVQFMKDWKPIGVAKDPVAAIHFQRDSDNLLKDSGFTIRMVVGGRVKMTQINQASDIATGSRAAVKKGDRLYIYATRHAWVDAKAQLLASNRTLQDVYRQATMTKEEEEAKRLEREEKNRHKANVHDPSYIIKKITERANEIPHASTYSSEHYWVFRPYISSDKQAPPSWLWTGQDEINEGERRSGCCFYIGKIDHIHGKRQNDKINECKEGIFPSFDDASYQEQLVLVDKFDVMLGIQ
jgi:hypothetical protein